MSLEGKAEASGVLRGRINYCDVLTISAYGIAVKNGFKGTETDWLESLKSAYVGNETPPDGTAVWINPDGEPTSTEDWEFDMVDGSTDTRRVVVVGSGESNGYAAILKVKQDNGEWVEIPAIVGRKGDTGRGIAKIETTPEALIITYTDNTTERVNIQSSVSRVAEINLPAAKWAGSGNLYSQVVSIDGVTEKSQVALNPSVEQLLVFYEKDLTFTTVNDGGIVTVYAIGQKPTNDYEVQVTITEVKV